MSITSSGVQGYEYQYLATAYLALVIGLDKIQSFFVEKKGSEDAYVVITLESKQFCIEIQVKREASKLDIPKLTSWLTHFQEGSVDNNLLHRINNSNHLVLFITQGRCNDDVVQLKRAVSEIAPHNAISITHKWNQEFTKALSEYSDNTTKLLTLRQNYCISQSKVFQDKNHLTDVLKKVIIWEEALENVLTRELKSLLNKKYHIAQSLTDNVQANLLDIIRDGRDKKLNVVPLVQDLINQKKAAAPIIDNNYKKRIEEEVLIEELKHNNLLLLTGTTLCGKSELAKHIAYHFFCEGYNYTINTDFQFINQFFSQNTVEDKIAILEDPWGHIEKLPESLSIWSKIESLGKNLSSNHKLIITTRREILKEIHSIREFNYKKINGKQWHDLTLTNSDFLIDYWRTITNERNIPREIIIEIEKIIAKTEGEGKLQIGQLQFLAGTDISDLRGKTKDQLEHIARMNSLEIGENIRDKNIKIAEILSLLALTSNTTEGVNKRELAYILSEDENYYTLIDKDFYLATALKPEDANYPKYDAEPTLKEEILNTLEYLERRFFITNQDDTLFFSHPNYLEAGRYLFFDSSRTAQKRFLDKVKKALFCIDPKTSFIVASQLSFLIKYIPNEFKAEIFDIAFKGLNSIYPSVEDRILVFLIEYMDLLDEDHKTILISKLESGGVSSSHIFWNNESIPFISTEGGIGFEEYLVSIEDKEIIDIENRFQRNEFVSSYESWHYLLAIRNDEDKRISDIVFEKFLKYKEVFIRESAAHIFVLRTGKTIGVDQLNIIFADEHPSVVFEGVRSCLMAWKMFSNSNKEQLLRLLKQMLIKRPIAIRLNKLFTTFAKDYQLDGIDWENMNEVEKKDLWTVWGELFPVFIKQIPIDVYFNPGLFGLTITESLNYLTKEAGLTILQVWYERIDYRIKNGAYPDEYEMSVADYLMKFTKMDYKVREVLFDKLITYPVTIFLISNIKWIVEYWEDMHISEKEKVISLVKSTRKDVRWIKAVLLNSYTNPPLEIQQEILGNPNFFQMEIQQIVKSFPENLLLDCLHVYFGHPQPLWWLAVHHHNKNFWNILVRYILNSKKDPFYHLCLRELLNKGVNGFSIDWRDGFWIWRNMCRSPYKQREQLLRLIYETATTSCALVATEKLWNIIIKAYQHEENEKELVSIIVEHIELLQQTGDKRDLFKFWGKNFIFDKLYPALDPDFTVIKLIEQVIKVPELESHIIPLIQLFVDKNISLKFFFSSIIINQLIEKHKLSEELKNALVAIPNHHEIVGKEKIILLKHILQEDMKLGDWVKS
ncbi:hypothetical protein [Sporocytophaga myxococcoides]|uniref:nSTAND3 domain-containing NTPase n=1 Tax=Sporocytophaga myxococcoides TaxID=153721 RepID=UPI00048F93FC|nr:hypothetical protein [Sporocytophaga myxococcoides]